MYVVSGAEVARPSAEIIVTPAMIEAGAAVFDEWLGADAVGDDEHHPLVTAIFMAMRRAELAEIVPRIEDEPERNAGWKP